MYLFCINHVLRSKCGTRSEEQGKLDLITRRNEGFFSPGSWRASMSLGLVLPSQGGAHFLWIDYDVCRACRFRSSPPPISPLCWHGPLFVSDLGRHHRSQCRLQAPPTGADDALSCWKWHHTLSMHVKLWALGVLSHVRLSRTGFVDDSSRLRVRLVSRESGVRLAANHRAVP